MTGLVPPLITPTQGHSGEGQEHLRTVLWARQFAEVTGEQSLSFCAHRDPQTVLPKDIKENWNFSKERSFSAFLCVNWSPHLYWASCSSPSTQRACPENPTPRAGAGASGEVNGVQACPRGLRSLTQKENHSGWLSRSDPLLSSSELNPMCFEEQTLT